MPRLILAGSRAVQIASLPDAGRITKSSSIHRIET
jgi:hypothetical protein